TGRGRPGRRGSCGRRPAPGGRKALGRQEEEVERGGEEDAQSAGDDDVRLERDVGEDLLAEAAGPGEERQRGEPDGGRRCDPNAGEDLGERERELDAPEELTVVEAEATGG